MTDLPADVGPASGREARLTEGVSRLAGSIRRTDIDRWLLGAGPFLLPLGFFVLGLAWYGASHTSRVYLQIPYLISGGLTGLALVFSGGFLYFSRWVTDLVRESRRNADAAQVAADRTVAALERIEALLGRSAAEAAAAPISAALPLVRTKRGSQAHRPDCSMVAGRVVETVGPDHDLAMCQVCRPDDEAG